MNPGEVMYHKAVMLALATEGLAIVPGGTYVDATFGGGGHCRAILESLDNGRVFAFDQDPDAARNLPDDPRLSFLNHNFRYLTNFLKLYQAVPVDGILADLGVSSHQFDQAERGFSTRYDGPLDMRMSRSATKTASDVVNNYEAGQMAEMFRVYGELPQAYRVAMAVVRYREATPVETTFQLKEALSRLAPPGRENKFFAQVFQALRIEVNEELDALKDFLQQVPGVLKPGGRLVVISYHSLEDRLVKNFIKAGNFSGEVEKDFFGNPMVPMKAVGKQLAASDEEILINPRARSARLRIGERTTDMHQDGKHN